MENAIFQTPFNHLFNSLQSLFLKAEKDDEEKEEKKEDDKEDMPKWAKNFLEALKPKLPEQTDKATSIPTPDEPLTEDEVEELEEEEENKPPVKTLGQKIADFLF